MKRESRYQVLGLILALVTVAMGVSCINRGDTIIAPGGGSSIFAPGSTASPSPDTGTNGGCVAPASVRVSPFLIDRANGAPAGTCASPPANAAGALPLNCNAAITATPKDATGNDLPAAAHGPNIRWSVESGSEFISITDYAGEPFNKNVRGVAAGHFVIVAEVCGTTGKWEAAVTN